MDLTDARQIDWAEFFDEVGKVPYYVHIHSNATQSAIPLEMKEWKEEYVNDFLSKSNWRKREHEGKYFYYDKLTGTSVWEPPAELVEFEVSLVKLTQQRFQEAARRNAQANASTSSATSSSSTEIGTEQQEEYDANDDNWVITASGSEDGYDSDRTPPDQSPNLYSPQYDDGSGEEDVEGGYFYDEQQDFDSTSTRQEDQGSGQMVSSDTATGTGAESIQELELQLEREASVELSAEEQERQRQAEIQLLEKKLSARDAIMEPDLYSQVARYLQLTEKHPQEVVSALCKGYVGYAQLTHVVCDWIQLAELEGEQPKEGTAAAMALKESQDNQMNQFIADEVAGLVKSRFDSTLADKLMDEMAREPEWLVDMMKKPKESMWRRLLIELSDEHRESILLNWCIRELSQLGYHREIAQVIREADYFSVCNELLIDTLFRLGSAIAEGGATDSATDTNSSASVSGSGSLASDSVENGGSSSSSNNDDIASLMVDLKRMCGSTEYMFIYTHFLLSEILTKLSPDTRSSSRSSKKRSLDQTDQTGEESSNSSSSSSASASASDNGASSDDPMKHMWRQKIRRVQEELDDHLVWQRDARGFSNKGWRGEALTSEAKFALQLTTENESIGVCSNAGAIRTAYAEEGRENVQDLVRVILESGAVTSEGIERLFGHFFQRSEEVVNAGVSSGSVSGGGETSREVVTLLPGTLTALAASLDAGGVSTSDSDASQAIMVRVLSHPQVLHVLVMNLVGGSNLGHTSNINGGAGSTSSSSSANSRYSVACILALASYSNEFSFIEHCKSLADAAAASPDSIVVAFAEKISHASDICLNLGSLSSNLYTSSKTGVIFTLMKESSLLSRIFLSWLEMKIHENLFVIRAKQLAVYPVIMQMLVVGMNTYVSQRHQCFQIIKNTFGVVSQVASSDDATSLGGGLDRESHREKDISETSLSIRQDLVDLLIHLMGKGFISEPFVFLRENIDSMDKALIRSFFVKLFGVIAPPYSTEFVRVLTEVLLLPRAKECVESTYFSTTGAKGLKQFRDDAFGPPEAQERKGSIVQIEQRTLLDVLVVNSLRIAKGTAV